MSRKDVVDYLLKTHLLETCVDYQLKKSPSNYINKQDIIQDAWLWIMTYNEAKLLDAFANGHMNALITQYLVFQIRSVTSEYWRRYVRFDTTTDEITQKQKDTIPDA